MTDAIEAGEIPLQADDGHTWQLIVRRPVRPTASLLWLPALGVAARHYLPFAETLAARGVAVFLHEWRGNGSSSLRASRESNWGYRELLLGDIRTSDIETAQRLPGVPRIVGGHSLGGQLATCHVGLASLEASPVAAAQRLWLVASGAPYWRSFPLPLKLGLLWVYRFAPWLADRHGHLPGRRLRFAGEEARDVVRDWARTGLSGRYAARGIEADIEAALSRIEIDVHGVRAQHDWMVPESSLRFLMSKLPRARIRLDTLDAATLGVPADHFSWMKQPAAVADVLLG